MVKPHSLSEKPGKSGKAKPARKAGTSKGGKPAGKGPAPVPEAGGETEKRILAAARKEFIAKGLDGARMQAVATEAGVNKALLHYYFRSKENLYQKVLEDTLGAVWGKLAEEFRTLKPSGGMEPLLRSVVTTFIGTLAANPEFPLFMFREMSSGGAAFQAGLPTIMRRLQVVPATITRTLEEEAAAGRIKPIQPIHFFMNMMGMITATFLLMPILRKIGPAFGAKVETGDSFMEDRIRSIMDTLLDGIRTKR